MPIVLTGSAAYQLPDILLCHILSYLTTKEAAATSILSKQWRYIWILVPNIDFDASQIRRYGRYRSELVISNILLIRKTPTIPKIRLQYIYYRNPDFLNTFISRNVEELDLSVHPHFFFTLPRTIFSCKTLVILKLTNGVTIESASSAQLPSLKVLHLSYVRYKGDESVRSLISGCPVLDDLLVERFRYDGVTRYDIYSRTLTNVCVDRRKLIRFRSKVDFLFVTNLNAPALKYLTLKDPLLGSFEVSNVDNLVEANLDVGYEVDAIMDILRDINNVKFLRLKGVFKAQRDMHDHEYITLMKKMPEFHNLVKLKLSDDSCIWCLFKGMLPKFPRLEHLTISRVHMCNKRRCDKPRFYPIPSKHVPACLSFHLTTFKLQKFEGSELEMCFVRCILNNSKALMDMTINYPPGLNSKKKKHIWKKLSRFERVSTRCQLRFEEGK